MMTDTIQNALKRLFCSIGGNADNVRNKDDINAILDEMAALNIGKEISAGGGGGGGGVLVVKATRNGKNYTCDKTAGQIISAAPNVVFAETDTYDELQVTIYRSLRQFDANSGTGSFKFYDTGDYEYIANALDEYPATVPSGGGGV